ncbi:rhomboid family intramembrane serine protease [Leptobacterium sp. I13]|uniref:rhomboid family intramembrane serine protease n=1 Tax=Leptobacterium meishanense TaxID=3128904 RepID=UPI0030EE88DF
MKKTASFVFSTGVVGYPLLFVLAIWIVYWFEVRFGYDFTVYGIFPRTVSGLKGIFFSPFIHSSLKHLYNNTLPFFFLSSGLFYFYRRISWKVMAFGTVLTGIITWLIARDAYHIGASGIIYMLSSFVFFRGIIVKQYRLIALSLIVVFLYGSLVWYVFPVDDRISWEGHLSGFLTGLIFAFLFKENNRKEIDIETTIGDENDPFLNHFDADGNFIPTSALENEKNENKE